MDPQSSNVPLISKLNPYPSMENGFLSDHIHLLCRSYRKLTGRELILPDHAGHGMAYGVFMAPCVVLSHNTAPDPILTYCNQAGLELFELDWADMVKTPSRYTAETMERHERSRLLETVASKGFIDDYTGIRISTRGRRFRIENATVWNLVDEKGVITGQAATFAHWSFL